MTTQERLGIKLAKKEKIVLSNGNEFIKIVAFVFSALSFSILTFVLIQFKISLISAITLVAIISMYYAFVSNLKKFVSASIKGEMLITTDVFNKNKVTSLKSIKSISSYTIYSVNYTKIIFKLDGVKYDVRMIKKIDSEQLENEEILKSAISLAS